MNALVCVDVEQAVGPDTDEADGYCVDRLAVDADHRPHDESAGGVVAGGVETDLGRAVRGECAQTLGRVDELHTDPGRLVDQRPQLAAGEDAEIEIGVVLAAVGQTPDGQQMDLVQYPDLLGGMLELAAQLVPRQPADDPAPAARLDGPHQQPRCRVGG